MRKVVSGDVRNDGPEGKPLPRRLWKIMKESKKNEEKLSKIEKNEKKAVDKNQ